MISIKEITNKSLTIKEAYMDGTHLLDEDGTEVNLEELLQRTYGDGTQFTIKVSTKTDRDLNE